MTLLHQHHHLGWHYRAHYQYAILILVIPLLSLLSPAVATAATLPAGFTESTIAVGLAKPTAMAVAPDGRIFICLQGGKVRVVKNGTMLSAPFASVTPDLSSGETGLLGIAFDPAFATNHFVYLYYTAKTPVIHNRVSRVTASGDMAIPGSEVVIFELDPVGTAAPHNGGTLQFGVDGKLYIAVGDNGRPDNSQRLTNLFGKILRINKSGSIPSSNPFYTRTTGNNRAIWALGLRNPFSFAVQRPSGKILINDVGEDTWEEINDGIAGANYGWPATEGPTTDARYHSPVYWYGHGSGDALGCSITGGVFYNPRSVTFPGSYTGSYFFADFCSGWIRWLNPTTNQSEVFATGIVKPVALALSGNGGMYYLARGSGSATGTLVRMQYVGT